jgi:hypothetical protein
MSNATTHNEDALANAYEEQEREGFDIEAFEAWIDSTLTDRESAESLGEISFHSLPMQAHPACPF